MEKQIMFDEQMFSMFKKIKIPTNPISFYLNIWRIEKDLSEWVRDYFYKAINEFITPIPDEENIENFKNYKNYSTFLLKLYYYTGFFKDVAISLNNFFDDIKYYDIWTYLQCAVYFDSNIKLKVIAIIQWKLSLLDDIQKINSKTLRDKFLSKHKSIANQLNYPTNTLMEEFEDYFYEIKDKKIIKSIYKHLNIDITKYKICYEDTNMSFSEYEKSKYYWYYNAISICFSHIVEKYNRNQKNVEGFIEKIQTSYHNIKKTQFVNSIIHLKDKFEAWKKLHKEMEKFFSSKNDMQKYFITYLINKKHTKLKKMFYWEAIKYRLSENEFAEIGGANLFYLQKIDKKIADFNLLLFFKQFKDSLIWVYNSIFWPFIKPYFYYILIFKSIKLPLKDWQKFFFLLMFFSAESYEEYIILQNISKSIERIWLWNYDQNENKLVFFVKRWWNLLKEFYSSIILLVSLIFVLYFLWLINIIMLWIIWLLIAMSLLKYLIFPGRFEILRSFGLIMFSILGYVWFTTIFPQITKPQYIWYVWKELHSLVNLDFSGAKANYENMISFVYWKNYKKNEEQFLSSIWKNTKKQYQKIKKSESIKQIVKAWKKIKMALWDTYIQVKPWKYLKYYIQKEIDKLNISKEKKDILAKKVTKKYILWYCKKHQDYYCRTKLENIPVWFKINISKIRQFIKEN